MKRRYFLIGVLTIVICFASSMDVLAASGLSKAEKSILENMKAGVEVDGKVVHMPVAYINQAENEMIKNDVDLTSKQAAFINSKIDEAMEILKTVNMKDITQMRKPEAVFRLLQIIDEAADEIGYNVSIDFSTMNLNITNPKGEMVFVSKNTINQTGFDFTSTIVVGVILITILLLCLFTAWKLRLFLSHRAKFRHYLRNKSKEGLGMSNES